MNHLLLITAFWCSTHLQAHAQQDSLYMCHADTTGGFHYGLAFVLFEESETSNFYTDELLWLTQPDGTASLTGNFVQPENAADGFVANIQFVNGMTWDEWSNQEFPTSYIDDFNVVDEEYLNWTYYTIDGSSSTLTGFGAYEGSSLQVMHAPPNLYYAYQVGIGANQRPTLEDGHGGWALVEGTYMNSETATTELEFESPVDFYLAYGCEPETVGVHYPTGPEYSIYPNPVSDRIHVISNYSSNSSTSNYTIHDELGRIVEQGTLGNGALDVGSLPLGNYYLMIDTEPVSTKLRFIKDR